MGLDCREHQIVDQFYGGVGQLPERCLCITCRQGFWPFASLREGAMVRKQSLVDGCLRPDAAIGSFAAAKTDTC